MKTTCILVILSVSSLFAANVKSQVSKVSIDVQDARVSEVLESIERQTDYLFVYNKNEIDLERRVDISITDQVVAEVLSNLFSNTNVVYAKEGSNIMLMQKKLAIQQQKITGTVIDANTGEPLLGVYVRIEGTQTGTVTDTDGRFTVSLSTGNPVLVISSIGYITEKVDCNGRTDVTIELVPDIKALDEIVVIGYGKQKKVDLTGSVASMNAEDLKNRPITNSTQILQGVSGLYVNQAGGQPGKDGATLRIRGLGTLNDNDPLVLVDGIEYPLGSVNPNDIESVSVLKDAASASIYGNRAANGVVLITTKKGKKDANKIEYNVYVGTQQAIVLPDLVTDPVEFMELRNLAQTNAGKATVDYSDALIEEYKVGRNTDPYIYPSNNWLDIMFGNAMIQEHNLRFSGGRDRSLYSLSLGYQDQDGILMGTGSSRISLRSNFSFKVKEWFNIGADISAFRRNIEEPASGVYNLMQMTFKAQGFHPTYLEDGRYANTFIKTPGHNVYRHPLVLAREGFWDTHNTRALVNIFAEVKLPKGFEYNVKAGVNILDGFNTHFVPQISYYQVKTLEESYVNFYTSNTNRHLTNQESAELNTTLYHTLSWKGSIHNLHNINVIVGSSFERFTSRNNTATIEGFLGNNLTEIDAGATNPVVSGSSVENDLVGIFGRLNYNYSEKYLFEANCRYDGSSRFAKGNRWGWFPSFSLGYRLDKERFLASLRWISLLKIRASYGSLGNQEIGNFKYVSLINSGYNYTFGGNINAGAAITSYNDPDITWETTTISNVGLDASFLNNRVDFTIDIYKKRTRNILREVNLPGQVGNLAGPVKNVGTVDNSGIELGINHQNSFGDFSYQFTGSINFNKNKVIELGEDEIISGKFITKKGYPINSYYILEADGIFQTADEIANSAYQNSTTKPGYLKYKDQNSDNVINDADRIITESTQPKFTYDFSINVSYKNLSLTSFFQGVHGLKTYPQGIVATPFWYGTSVTREWVNNSWTPERTNAKLPIMTTYELSSSDNFRNSNFWLKDASYLRLKNIQLSYTLPKVIIEKIKLQNLTVFVNGQNILTFSKMKDFDPEKSITQGDYYEFPSVKTYTAGINVTF